jgi:hypothetical protein
VLAEEAEALLGCNDRRWIPSRRADALIGLELAPAFLC